MLELVQPYRHMMVTLACAETDSGLLDYTRLLCALGRKWDVRFVHVTQRESPDHLKTASQALEQAVAQRFERLRAAVNYSCHVLCGERTDELLTFAAQHQIDLVLIGHRRSRTGRRSLVRRLAMKAPCSVWMVPDGCPAVLRHILIPVDFSKRAGDALGVATSLAALAGFDRCHALHVRFDPASVTYEEHAAIEGIHEAESFSLFIAPIDLHGIDVIPLFEEGPNVPHTINRIASEKDIDLIVMGTRGRSRAASVLLGSETDQTIRETKIPILVVKHFGARRKFLEVLLDKRFRGGGQLRFD